MINVAMLKPSDIERLSEGPLSHDDANDILTSLRRALNELSSDGGANDDRIYMAAQMLTMAGVWEKLGAEPVARFIADAPESSMKVFIEGLPHAYATDVAYFLMAKSLSDDFSGSPIGIDQTQNPAMRAYLSHMPVSAVLKYLHHRQELKLRTELQHLTEEVRRRRMLLGEDEPKTTKEATLHRLREYE